MSFFVRCEVVYRCKMGALGDGRCSYVAGGMQKSANTILNYLISVILLVGNDWSGNLTSISERRDQDLILN